MSKKKNSKRSHSVTYAGYNSNRLKEVERQKVIKKDNAFTKLVNQLKDNAKKKV